MSGERFSVAENAFSHLSDPSAFEDEIGDGKQNKTKQKIKHQKLFPRK